MSYIFICLPLQAQVYNLSIIPLHIVNTVDKAEYRQDPSWVAGWEADIKILQTDTKAQGNF